jgi:hypothetical protein
LRSIQEKEEITISYAPSIVTHTLEARQKYLRQTYGFTCCCTRCETLKCSPNKELQSDKARIWLHRFDQANTPNMGTDFTSHRRRFEDWCFNPAHLESDDYAYIKRHRYALTTIEQEGLQILGVVEHMELIAMYYGALADVEEFTRWIKKVRREKERDGTLSQAEVCVWEVAGRSRDVSCVGLEDDMEDAEKDSVG